MIYKSKTSYEAPETEVFVVRIERTILSGQEGVRSMRQSYGTANEDTWE